MELGCPTFVPVNDLEMGFEKIVKIAHARGVCKQQAIISTFNNEEWAGASSSVHGCLFTSAHLYSWFWQSWCQCGSFVLFMLPFNVCVFTVKLTSLYYPLNITLRWYVRTLLLQDVRENTDLHFVWNYCICNINLRYRNYSLLRMKKLAKH